MTHRIYYTEWRNKTRWVREYFAGTRSQCLTYLRNLRRAGRPTHFYFVSQCTPAKAQQRYGDREL